ncbi:MAG: thioredoxin-disulfide reductase [Candidatus Auribacter fodinae]|jgi:thioredoxin reductase (NADPH)|uniref:Thioredoxin reductase n=1 Tax=Candidatus Auribacter fodinae TaxID=2093366 RepID=A0A3A4R4N1_9BACT|nr:MAG: thioredoxin-disulfide reductase [Candidatus Auribacter fodinae]
MENLIIIGSGPAALTAAIYSSRANLNPLVIEGLESGGQLMTTTEVENYPGFRNGIMGPELIDEMRVQAERFGARFVMGNVTAVDFKQQPFIVKTDSDTFSSHSVIIATGASPRKLGIESEKRLWGHGVSSCATCDGAFFRGKEVCIVGGGDSALEEALFLTRFSPKVTVIHRRDELRASKIMRQRALEHDKIAFQWNSVIQEILGNDKNRVCGVRLKNVVTGELTDYPCEGVFIAIGHIPNTKLFEGQIDMDNGYIKIQHPYTKTNIEGVFAAGDLADHYYRQAITASAMGCKAAIDAERYLAEKNI